MKWLPLLAVVACVIAAHPSRAQDDSKDLQKLAEKIGKELRAKQETKEPAQFARPDTSRVLAAQFSSALASGDEMQIETALGQISACLDSEELRTQCNELAVKFRAKRAEKEKAAVTEINVALENAAKAVKAAKAPSDLDGTIESLGRLRDRRNAMQQGSPEVSAANYRVEPTLQFVTRGQDYLSETASGNVREAREALQNLSNMDRGAALIPRSEILARLHKREEEKRTQPKAEVSSASVELSVEEILRQIKTPDDLHGAMAALTKVNCEEQSRGRGARMDISTTIQRLSALDQAYSEFKAGLSTKVDVIVPKAHVYEPFQSLTASVRAQVIAAVLPRYLGLPEDVKPKAVEGPHLFLDRIAAEAMSKNDYLLAAKARETQRLLRDGVNNSTQESSQAGLFITAHNQETAKQFALAVTSYEKALAIPNDLVPAKVIGERLAAIKAEHPQEYQQGLDNYLSPPMSRSPYPPGWPPGRPQSRSAQPMPQPALSIPAASASPSPAATNTPHKP